MPVFVVLELRAELGKGRGRARTEGRQRGAGWGQGGAAHASELRASSRSKYSQSYRLHFRPGDNFHNIKDV